MKANMRFGIWWFVRNMKILVPLFLVGLVVMLLNNSEHRIQISLDFLVTMCSVIGYLFPASWFLEGKHLTFSMGNTRKNFFLQSQIHKLIVILVVVFFNFIANSNLSLFSTVSSVLFLTCSSETIGVLCLRFGKYGLIIFTIIAGIVGGVCGFLMVGEGLLDITVSLVNIFQGSIQVIFGIAAGLVLTAINWLLFRKIDV